MGLKQALEPKAMIRQAERAKADIDANIAKVQAPCEKHETHQWNFTRGAWTDMVYWKCDCGAHISDREYRAMKS